MALDTSQWMRCMSVVPCHGSSASVLPCDSRKSQCQPDEFGGQSSITLDSFHIASAWCSASLRSLANRCDGGTQDGKIVAPNSVPIDSSAQPEIQADTYVVICERKVFDLEVSSLTKGRNCCERIIPRNDATNANTRIPPTKQDETSHASNCLVCSWCSALG